MGSYHSNHSSYQIEIENAITCSPAYRCYMWIMVRIGFRAAEEMSFENVDRQWRMDDDGQLLPGYTLSSPVSLRLRWANKCSASTGIYCVVHNYPHYRIFNLHLTAIKDYQNPPWVWGADRKMRQRVAVWHHETLPSDAKKWSRGTDFLSTPNNHDRFSFLHTFWSP